MEAGEHVQCFDIEVEIGFWMSNIGRLKWSSLEADRSVLIELIKFAYDGYILYGGVGQKSSWMFLMTRFKASKLSRKIQASYAEIVFAEVWSRVYGEKEERAGKAPSSEPRIGQELGTADSN